MKCHLTPYRQGIYTLDAGYQRPKMASIHLLVQNGRVAIIDTGINDSLPMLLAALAQLGLNVNAVDWILLTHVHLDHAGGAGLFMKHCPNAKLVVHPRGSRHMVDPSKLIEGTRAVYGDLATRKLYGNPLPIPVSRIVETTDGMTINLDNRAIYIFDSPGHAKHHVCYWDDTAKAVFTGDTLGISYREMDLLTDADMPHQFVFATTTPVHFDPPVLIKSIDRILSFNPKVAYLTHFGEMRELPEKGNILKKQINAFAAFATKHKDAAKKRHQLIKAEMITTLYAEAKSYGSLLSNDEILAIWESDIELNTQGLLVWLDKMAH